MPKKKQTYKVRKDRAKSSPKLQDLKLIESLRKPGAGRKWFDGKDEEKVLSKLIEAWDMDCTDEQAALHADISIPAYYRYMNKRPKLRETRELHKQNMTLQAKSALLKDLKNPFTRGKSAQWILERKEKEWNLVQKSLVGEDKESPFGGTLADAMLRLKQMDLQEKQADKKNN